MNRDDLSVVVLYCTQERDLIDRAIRPLVQVSSDVVVVSSSHFFTGAEDLDVQEKLKGLQGQYGIKPVILQWKHIPGAPQNFWPKELRLHGFGATRVSSKYVMFVDADEILRCPPSFITWFSTLDPTSKQSYKLSNYWYFMSERRRSKVMEDSIILVPRFTLKFEQFRAHGVGERESLVSNPQREVKDLDGNVFFDHLSWVRDRDILVQKVSTWSHRQDKDWLSLVKKALEEDPLTTADFVHGYEYDILEQ
jgi:hypothetical protein